MWWKKHKWKVVIPVLIAAVLAGVFYYGGNAPGARGWSVSDTPAPSGDVTGDITETLGIMPTGEPGTETSPLSTAAPGPLESIAPSDSPAPTAAPTNDPGQTSAPANSPEPADAPAPSTAPPAESPEPAMAAAPDTGRDKYLTDPVPAGKPLPVEPQDVKTGPTAYTCTISISCLTILDNLDLCNPEKKELVPEDGWILQPVAVTFYEGESVFNVLQRVCKQQKIHMEFVNVAIYNSAYIEGIHNLYEFDVGEHSGWMYKVNDWFPNYGCSRYQLSDGDIIDWVYTCDLGHDVGGGYATGG